MFGCSCPLEPQTCVRRLALGVCQHRVGHGDDNGEQFDIHLNGLRRMKAPPKRSRPRSHWLVLSPCVLQPPVFQPHRRDGPYTVQRSPLNQNDALMIVLFSLRFPAASKAATMSAYSTSLFSFVSVFVAILELCGALASRCRKSISQGI